MLISGLALGQEQTSQSTIEANTPNSVDKADELITNPRYRASTGSLSKMSLNSTMIYRGGSLSKPMSANRPNIAGRGDTASVARLNVDLQGTYRLNALNRINAGIGLQSLAPFHSSIETNDPQAQLEFDQNQGNVDISNPYIQYRHMNNLYGVQTILTAGLTQFTAGNLREDGYQNEIAFEFDTLYEVGTTGLSLGACLSASKFVFDNNDPAKARRQQDIVVQFEPQVEYAFNDTFNFRTVFRTFAYQNNREDSTMNRRPSTQDVGLGISVSRNVFLFPNLQFSYDDLRWENTNVGFVANINMF